MIHYHGTPCGGTRENAARFMRGRHILIPFLRPEDLATAADVCQSMIFDNSAWTAEQQGISIDFPKYIDFCYGWYQHPAFDWAIIPDVIGGTEEENDALIESWPRDIPGAPVWHLHESLERLASLCANWRHVCLGSSGQWGTPGTSAWWGRMSEAMGAICNPEGRPPCRLHGLRMLSPTIFTRLPLASADSTNAVRNGCSIGRFGSYPAPSLGGRMNTIADRIEAHQSAARWESVTMESETFDLLSS